MVSDVRLMTSCCRSQVVDFWTLTYKVEKLVGALGPSGPLGDDVAVGITLEGLVARAGR